MSLQELRSTVNVVLCADGGDITLVLSVALQETSKSNGKEGSAPFIWFREEMALT